MQTIIGVHIAAAVGAVLLGTVILSSSKGTRRHKLLGRIWVVLMSVTAIGSFNIRDLSGDGDLSWIHALSAFTMISMVYAVYMIRQGNRRAHLSAMIGCLIGALVAGALTFHPSRIIGGFFFTG
ncbi:MAG: DUF2306 domain-containing protein [Acidiferrobacterales bacterium]|nr:DUF2306 domain-containing protein [Acidiferrobacterales bacterium]